MATKPVLLIAGDTWTRAWRLSDAAGVAINLAGASARLHVRDALGAKVASASTTDLRLTLDGPNGKVALRLPASATLLEPGGYRFALELTFADGTVQTLEVGTLAVQADLTYD